jgi:hypothetical protein
MVILRRRGKYVGAAASCPNARRGTAGGLVVLALTFALCATVAPAWVFGASGAGMPQTSAGTVLVTLPWGTSDGQVGLVRAQEGLTRGPEALAVSPDGRIAVLDSVNRRLVLLDQTGKSLGKVPVRLAQPRFLAVDDQSLYVLDAEVDSKLTTYSWAGKLLSTVAAPAFDDVVTGLFATSQGPCVEIAHRTTLLLGGTASALAATASGAASRGTSRELAGRPLDRQLSRVAKVSYKPKDGVRVHTAGGEVAATETSGESDFQPSVALGQPIDHLVSVDGDGKGGLLIGARLLRDEKQAGAQGTLAITRLAAAGPDAAGGAVVAASANRDSVLFLAESDFAYLGQPYVVAPSGRVFQAVGSANGYTILVHSFPEVQP